MTEKELIDKTNEAITELVYDKHELQKAYNYYNGKRDPEQFRYLEENFGIGSPTSVEFTPLLKKHVDALVGEYLGTPILPKVSCKDSDTISNITRDKQLKITEEIVKFLKGHLNNSILKFIEGKDITDKSIKNQLDKIIQDVDQTFISQYEIAAQNIIQYIMQSRETDLITKLRQLLTDLLITGYSFFRVKKSIAGTNIEIEVLNPLNTFVDRNPESPYVKNSYRSVVRNWMSRSQILAKYGRELSKEDVERLKEEWKKDESTSVYKRTYSDSCVIVDGGHEVIPGYPDDSLTSYRHQLLPVYDVEWLETDDNFIMNRYNTIRIGEEIYILRGLDQTAIRSKDNPNFCSLSVNGVYFLNRSQQPYSLILKCAHLQDRYDLLNYYRDNLIANSGTAGVIMDMSLLPTNLGVKWPERVQKWLAYKKGGIMWIDSSQEGDSGKAPNQIYNGFDDTLKASAVQAIELAIQSVEQITSSITGVFRERLNGIEQRDAVTNIKQGVANSFIITKPYYQQMDLITCEILLDSLNQAKIVYKNGITGTIILGDKYQKIFTALPEHFTITDYDIHIISSTDVMQDLQTLKSIIPELIKGDKVEPDIIFEALTAKSLSDLKYKVQKSIKIKKEENDQIMQLSQKLEETTQQAQQLQKQLEQAQQKIEKLNEQKLNIEQQKMQLEYKVNWFKAQSDSTYKDRQMDIEEKRTDIELYQLHDGNPYNDKIRQLK